MPPAVCPGARLTKGLGKVPAQGTKNRSRREAAEGGSASQVMEPDFGARLSSTSARREAGSNSQAHEGYTCYQKAHVQVDTICLSINIGVNVFTGAVSAEQCVRSLAWEVQSPGGGKAWCLTQHLPRKLWSQLTALHLANENIV